jgi:hypothetical protein
MSSIPSPLAGQMFMWDYMVPPLTDNSYRLRVNTNTKSGAGDLPIPEADSYFDVIGPRFRLSAADVGGVFPPRNGHGDFSLSIPHIALYDRTLPWERLFDPSGKITDPPPINGANTPAGRLPWLALLLLQEGEYTLLQNAALESVLPPGVLSALGYANPSGITCDAIQLGLTTLESILPNLDEIVLLTHVRQVNVEDRELSAGSSNGWFSVVMSNRLPAPGQKYRACLVSLEGRTDLFGASASPVAEMAINLRTPDAIIATQFSGNRATLKPIRTPIRFNVSAAVVLLYSWQFECIGEGTFEELAQNLDVAMIGSTVPPGHPPVTDTGHIAIQVGDRSGAAETAWYRGPLCPLQLTRDPLGPYHSADQARIATPETGGEDVSYAAAFEAGRLLAAADARLAQELMRWRRNSYSASAYTASLKVIQAKLPTLQALDIHAPVTPLLMQGAAEKMVGAAGVLVDTYRMKIAARAPGMNPALVQQAFGLSSVAEAVDLLGGAPGVLGTSVPTQTQTLRENTTLENVALDSAGMQRLTDARTRIVNNATVKIGS